MKSTLRAARPGFTLIEIMVATAISVFLVVGVVQIASSSITAYNNAMSVVSTTAVSRQVLDTLESDIQSAVLRNDGNVWMECISENNPDPSTKGNFDAGACQALYLFSTPTDRDRFKPGATGAARVEYAGDVCAVRYRVMNDTPLPTGLSTTDKAYCLNRLIVNSEDTFKNILTKITDENAPSTPSVALNSGTRPGTGGGSYALNRPADIFGMNVVGLTPVFIFKKTDPTKTPSSWYFYAAPDSAVNQTFFRQYFKDGFGSETAAGASNPVFFRTLQVSAGKYAISASSGTTNKPAPTAWKNATLAAVLISTTIVDDVGADMIRVSQSRNGGAEKIPDAEWAQIIQSHGRTYVRRINIPGAN